MNPQNHKEFRAKLVDELSSLLLGPRDPNESIESNPSDTYMTGVLWPRETELSAAEDERVDASGGGKDEDAADVEVPGYRSVRPCSIGITFSVPTGVTVRLSTMTTARYVFETPEQGNSEESEAAESTDLEGDGPKSWWRRQQLNYVYDVEPRKSSAQWRVSDFKSGSGDNIHDPLLELHIRYRVIDDVVTITVTMINLAAPDRLDPESAEAPFDSKLLFQTGIQVTSPQRDRTLQIKPRSMLLTANDVDSRSNALIYRQAREFAVGHGVSAQWPEQTSESTTWVATSWLPLTFVKSTSFKGHDSLQTLRNQSDELFSASWLSSSHHRDDITGALSDFCDIYEGWVENSVAGRVDQFTGVLKQAATDNTHRCEQAVDRMRRGVRSLVANDIVWQAFTMANQALDAQARYGSKGERAGPLVWRPFQLAFILLVIPGIADKRDADRQTMDLLWFPTGGGKTEAYLGLTAFAIFYKRLVSEPRRSTGGTDVLMRYTLRLLTVQQFQRAAALITACESVRQNNVEKLGNAPIELGLYVGMDTTPNKLVDAKERLDEEISGSQPKSTPRQLLNCPVCGSSLAAGNYHIDTANVRIDIVCRNSGCEWDGRPLPVHTVDETIFANPPSLVIGTVDKFAQLPRSKDLGSLFGLHSAVPNPPELIIQDELHLISGPLGTITGLYESAIDLLCSKDGVRPKVIGSTATIGEAEAQVRSLFDRAVLQFPPPGIDAADSFFAVRDDDAPDRLYLGVSSAGRSPKFALQALLGSVMQSVYAEYDSGAWDDAVVDPYWTAVAYFNSLRELGGAIVMMLDDVPRTVRFVSGRQGVGTRPLELPAIELSGRIASSEIPRRLIELDRKLGGDVFEGEPVDAVLASSMLSVGVDVPRLGLMVVNGQPKSTAEYIQATSRVGRGLPGLVCTLLNFGRPRDVAHFEHFQAYHSALYRSVEATSVTPWAPRARDKALHAVFISAVRQLSPGLRNDTDAREFEDSDALVEQIVRFLVERSKSTSCGVEDAETRLELDRIVKRWSTRAAEQRLTGGKLRYWERQAPFGRASPHLMRDAEKIRKTDSPAWATPNSMREIEPSTVFVLKEFHNTSESTRGEQ